MTVRYESKCLPVMEIFWFGGDPQMLWLYSKF